MPFVDGLLDAVRREGAPPALARVEGGVTARAPSRITLGGRLIEIRHLRARGVDGELSLSSRQMHEFLSQRVTPLIRGA